MPALHAAAILLSVDVVSPSMARLQEFVMRIRARLAHLPNRGRDRVNVEVRKRPAA